MVISSRLSIIFNAGVDEDGEMILRTKSFNNVKETATDQELLEIVNALAPLQQFEVNEVKRTNVHSLL